MKNSLYLIVSLCILMLFPFSLSAQTTERNDDDKTTLKADLSDRQAIITTIKDFYIGDHTGSTPHKKRSMHENGAYRHVNKEGKYVESIFQLDSDNADPNYKEELLSIEIYDSVALARLRLDQFRSKLPEYKLMILHKVDGAWKITSIVWGFGITQ